MTTITEAQHEELSRLLQNEFVQDDISATRNAINQAVCHACSRLEKQECTNANVPSTLEDIWQTLQTECKQWRMSPPHPSGVVKFCLFDPGNAEHALRYVIMDANKTWTGYAQGKVCDMTWEDLPEMISNVNSLRKVLNTRQSALQRLFNH